MMMEWSRDKIAICEKISAFSCKLIVILKTKDDPILLERWIFHHMSLSSEIQIVIADNCSSDAVVLAVYAQLSSSIPVFQFSGFHNNIHSRAHFPELFDAVSAAASHYLILDTDEFLISFNGKEHSRRIDSNLLCMLEADRSYPVTWLPNVRGSEQVFDFGETSNLLNLLRFGKPILSARMPFAGVNSERVIHNAHVPRFCFSDKSFLGLFILHLCNLSDEQRLRTNRNKLSARGIAVDGLSLEGITRLDLTKHPDHTVHRLMAEIKEIFSNMAEGRPIARKANNTVTFYEDGKVEFSDPRGQSLFNQFILDYDSISETHLGSFKEWDPRFYMDSADELFNLFARSRASGNLNLAKRIAVVGVSRFPHFLDQYGHPAFRKEVIRLLLSQSRFDKAEGFFPIAGSPGGSAWHEILLARALYEQNQTEKAMIIWSRILDRDPNNQEAKAVFSNK